MNIILQAIEPYKRLLGEQKFLLNVNYRPMYYVIEHYFDDGLLLYNTMTKELIFLNKIDEKIYNETPHKLPQLIKDWFLVPLDYDDRQLCLQIREIGKAILPPQTAITHYTIFTTTDCNARCFYCYEEGCIRFSMSSKTAQDTAKYIIKHCEGEEVTLNWFGGEPLYNKEVISIICDLLQKTGIKYTSKIISNGYLFNKETIKEAKELWKLKETQITLDGTEKIYNRTKAYIYKNINAYKQVIGNIHQLLKSDISVKIRLNIDTYNANDLSQLTKELHQEFSEEKNLKVYLHQLYHKTEKKDNKQLRDERQDIYQIIFELESRLRDYKLAQIPKLNRKIKLNNCIADNDKCITILPSGNIGKCDLYLDDSFIGHVNKEEFDNDMINDYKVRQAETDTCPTCFYYPDCIHLNICRHHSNCFPEEREKILKTLKLSMLNTYNEFNK